MKKKKKSVSVVIGSNVISIKELDIIALEARIGFFKFWFVLLSWKAPSNSSFKLLLIMESGWIVDSRKEHVPSR